MFFGVLHINLQSTSRKGVHPVYYDAVVHTEQKYT